MEHIGWNRKITLYRTIFADRQMSYINWGLRNSSTESWPCWFIIRLIQNAFILHSASLQTVSGQSKSKSMCERSAAKQWKTVQRHCPQKKLWKKELVAIPACAWWKALFIKKKNQHITIWAMNIFDFAPQICGATQPSLLPFSIPGDFGFLLHSWECFQFPVYLSGMKDACPDLNYWLDLWSFP